MIDFNPPSHPVRDAFRTDVLEGLRKTPKQLPCRWLYDDAGSELFEEITRLEEYYPTRTETEILRTHAAMIAGYVGDAAVLIEYGAGAGIKTEILLNALRCPSAYVPVDISGDFLGLTARRLRKRYPGLDVRPVVADFTQEFALAPRLPADGRRTAFFPGSTIGNLDFSDARTLLHRMRRHVGPGGRAVIGVDLVKDTSTLLRAYDDACGVTAAFNLNLLHRINRELEGTLPVDSFRHEVRWNPVERAVEMHLRCAHDFEAVVDGQGVRFRTDETIHTESSRKFDLQGIGSLATQSGWQVDHLWMDDLRRFAVVGMSVI